MWAPSNPRYRLGMADALVSKLIVRPGSKFQYKGRQPDDDLGWNKEQAKAELIEVKAKIAELQYRLIAQSSQALLVVFQAMDAAGKDGVVKNVFSGLIPAGVKVTGFKAPVGDESRHDYLWRVHQVVPGHGEIGVWNRSHYEDVLVVRVKNFVPQQRWEKRYRHIRDFEQLLTDEGTRVIKVNLHVSNEVQRTRLQERIDDHSKGWKFRVGDLDDRKLWPQFMEAYEIAIRETSTNDSPWYVVPADRKWVRDLATARIVLATLRDMDPQIPPPNPEIVDLKVV
jgi:PPK2 family polyphosphate:nucleotide phosphotransferase